MDLRELLAVAWKRRFIVALVFVLSGGLGTAFAIARTQMYESTVTIAMTPAPGQGFVPTDYLSAVLGTYAETAESGRVRQLAEREPGVSLPGTVESTAERNTGILRIYGRADTPEGARLTADATARAFLQTIAGDELLVANIVDPALVPTVAVQPRPPLIIGTSLLVGLGAGILLALVVDRMRRRIEAPGDLAELTDAPLLAQIPRSRELARSGPQVVSGDPREADLEESFRSLRTNLSFVADDSQTIQVTSATDRQGKSTVVANLGLAFARTGARTVIVDADLRLPGQAEIFRVDTIGLRGTVQGAAMPGGSVATRRTQFANLSVMPSGPPREDPTELLQVRFARVLESLQRNYDIILIDTPPSLPVSDARIVSRWSDGVVLVVAAGEERPSSLKHAVEELELAGARLKGVVLNRAPSAPAHYGYYYGPTSVARPVRPPAAGLGSEPGAHHGRSRDSGVSGPAPS